MKGVLNCAAPIMYRRHYFINQSRISCNFCYFEYQIGQDVGPCNSALYGHRNPNWPDSWVNGWVANKVLNRCTQSTIGLMKRMTQEERPHEIKCEYASGKHLGDLLSVNMSTRAVMPSLLSRVMSLSPIDPC